MLPRLRERLRPPSLATAIALLALSIAVTGTAVAAAPHLFAIAGKSGGHVAKVSSAGALSTTASVAGAVRIAAPATPFSFTGLSFVDSGVSIQFGATNATLAFTGFRVSNQTNVNTSMSIYQYPETSTLCDQGTAGSRKFLGQFSVPAGQTVDEQLSTPQIVKPIPGFPDWCFINVATGPGGAAVITTYSGYVVSGTFTAAAALQANATRQDVQRVYARKR